MWSSPLMISTDVRHLTSEVTLATHHACSISHIYRHWPLTQRCPAYLELDPRLLLRSLSPMPIRDLTQSLLRVWDQMRKIVMNPEVIAIDQDPLATAADRTWNDTNGGQLWARPLFGGDHAILLFNGHERHVLNLSVTWAELGWPAAQPRHVRDVWLGRDLGTFTRGFTAADLPPRDVALLRISSGLDA